MNDHNAHKDMEFMNKIVAEICDYAVENGMIPDDTLSTVAQNILGLLQISTFNNWKKGSGQHETSQN